MPDGLNSPEVFPPAVGHLIEDLTGKDISGFFNKNRKREMGRFNKDGWDFVNKLFAQAYSRNAESLSAMEREIKEAENNDFNSPGYKHIFASLRGKITLELLEREDLRKKGAFKAKAPVLEPPEKLVEAQTALDVILEKEAQRINEEIWAMTTASSSPDSMPEPFSRTQREKKSPKKISGIGRWWNKHRTSLVAGTVLGILLTAGSFAADSGVVSAPAIPQPPPAGEAGGIPGVRESLARSVKAEAGKKQIPGVPRNYQQAAEEAERLTGVSAAIILGILDTESNFGTNPLMKKSPDLGPAQFRKGTWAWLKEDLKTVLGRDANYNDPDDAALGIAFYLEKADYKNNPEMAIREYHRGKTLRNDQGGYVYWLKVNQAASKFENGY